MENSFGKNILEHKKDDIVLELFNLNQEQKLELEKRLKENKGLVRIFVHPISALMDDRIIEGQERVSTILVKTIFSEKSPPIIILEDLIKKEVWKKGMKERMKENSKMPPNEIYLVPTLSRYPFPIVLGRQEPSSEREWLEEDNGYIEEGMTKFVSFLNDVGVKKIIVGGAELEIFNDNLDRCVGNFIRFMKHYSDIEMKLSLGTIPINKNDIKQTNPDLIKDL